jgi:hypothetical protein
MRPITMRQEPTQEPLLKNRSCPNFPRAIVILLLGAAASFAGSPKEPSDPEKEDRWHALLAVPGFMTNIAGTIGIGGVTSGLNMQFGEFVNEIDMIAALRGEVSYGRFGLMAELLHLGLSDGVGVGGPLQKIDVQLDEYLADLAFRVRLVEGERGYLDGLVGVRYTNIYQNVHLQSDDGAIDSASSDLVDDVGRLIRDRLKNTFGQADFTGSLSDAIKERLGGRLEGELGPDPKRRQLGVGPLAGRHPGRVAAIIGQIVVGEEARIRQKIEGLKLAGAALEERIESEVASANRKIEKKIARALKDELNSTYSRTDDWWDPYIGLRGRLNITFWLYLIGRGDIGGFGIGSDLMWQTEAAVGVDLTRNLFAEAGYRAISFDYDHGGLTYNTITHGAQLTMGVRF